MKEHDLQERLFVFAIGIIKMLRLLKGGNELKIISNQLVKSPSSSGANYEESQAAVSRAEFGFIAFKRTQVFHIEFTLTNKLRPLTGTPPSTNFCVT